MEKICNVCNQSKSLEDFYFKNSKPIYCCKVCHKALNKEYVEKNKEKVLTKIKKWQQTNPKKRKIIKQKWVDKNPDYHKEYRKNYYKNNPNYNKEYYTSNIEKRRDYAKKYRKENPKHNQNYVKKRLKTDVNFRLAYNMRHRIIYVLRHSKTTKTSKTTRLLGCNYLELKQYLESKFLPTMSWDNYGTLWHVDHIKPCASFNLADIEEQKQCFHYTNLQPLFATTTIIDGIEYVGNTNKGKKLI